MPSTPSADEQLLLEWINRFRLDPDGEAARLTGVGAPAGVQSAMTFFGVSVSALQTQLAALSPVAPLAWNGNLADAADGHNQAMITADQQTHQAPGEPGIGQRATNAGYNWSRLGENIYAYSNDVAFGHAAFVIDWGYDAEDNNGNNPDWRTLGDGMQDPPGHRNNLISTEFTEIGLSVVAENNAATGVGPQLITEDFGNRAGYQAQFVGVVIDDGDGDAFYDIGEGLGGVSILLQRQGGGSYTTTSWASGGWQIAVPAGTYTITFSGGGLAAPVVESATIGTVNVKVDAIVGPVSTTPTQGDDVLTGTAGNDRIKALGGNDTINGLAGDDTLNGGAGSDTMHGGAGNDVFYVDVAGDVVVELAGEGTDRVIASIDLTLGANVENLTMTGAARVGTGNALANLIEGSTGRDTIVGGNGADQLYGNANNDTLNGNSGNDNLYGGAGKDSLTGGGGGDQFIFADGDTSADRSLADVIADYNHAQGDLIRLKAMDADTTLGGDQRFAFIGTGAFTGHARQLHYVQAGGNTFVEGDTNGDGTADFSIRLVGTIALSTADFVL